MPLLGPRVSWDSFCVSEGVIWIQRLIFSFGSQMKMRMSQISQVSVLPTQEKDSQEGGHPLCQLHLLISEGAVEGTEFSMSLLGNQHLPTESSLGITKSVTI